MIFAFTGAPLIVVTADFPLLSLSTWGYGRNMPLSYHPHDFIMGFFTIKKNLLLSQLSHDYPFILAISIHSKPYKKPKFPLIKSSCLVMKHLSWQEPSEDATLTICSQDVQDWWNHWWNRWWNRWGHLKILMNIGNILNTYIYIYIYIFNYLYIFTYIHIFIYIGVSIWSQRLIFRKIEPFLSLWFSLTEMVESLESPWIFRKTDAMITVPAYPWIFHNSVVFPSWLLMVNLLMSHG